MMDLVVLGSSASAPAAGDACAGYLVRQGDTEILLDCGSGVLSRLLDVTRLDRLSAIFISHFHPDHYLDLVTMRYALRYGEQPAPRPLLLIPPGGSAFLARLGDALRGKRDFFADTFKIREYVPTECLRVGAFKLRFQATTHDEPCWAIGLAGAGRLVYSGDTGPSTDLARFARDTDLFLCEATYPDETGSVPASNHLTGRLAGELARLASPRHLVLTHFWPGFDREQIVQQAETAFGWPIGTAAPGRRFTVSRVAEAVGSWASPDGSARSDER